MLRILFASGFRPFFFCAGLYAGFAMVMWLGIYTAGATPLPNLPAHFWHAHEMLFGFVAASIAGFMLTAVPSWTGGPGYGGRPLQFLVLLWLAGRVGMVFAASLPVYVAGALQLAFIPALVLTLAPSLLRAANRNRILLVVLLLFWLCEILFVAGVVAGDVGLIGLGLRGGLNIVLLLITVIGGRIVPAFTGNALRARQVLAPMRDSAVLNRCTIVAMLVFAISDTLSPMHVVAASAAGVAGIAQALRLAGWQGVRTLSQPLVLILHVAYLWLPVGLLLKAFYVLGDARWAAYWQHALAAGSAGTMILAVMTRASLGHTGRPLKAHPLTVFAYMALSLGIATRVFGPALLPAPYRTTVLAAGSLWGIAFALFLIIYVPVFVRARIDGKPG